MISRPCSAGLAGDPMVRAPPMRQRSAGPAGAAGAGEERLRAGALAGPRWSNRTIFRRGAHAPTGRANAPRPEAPIAPPARRPPSRLLRSSSHAFFTKVSLPLHCGHFLGLQRASFSNPHDEQRHTATPAPPSPSSAFYIVTIPETSPPNPPGRYHHPVTDRRTANERPRGALAWGPGSPRDFSVGARVPAGGVLRDSPGRHPQIPRPDRDAWQDKPEGNRPDRRS